MPRCWRSCQQVAGPNRSACGIDQHVDAAAERHRPLSVRERAFLAHDHSGLDTSGTADDAGHTTVIGATADYQFARVRGIDRDDHSRLSFRSPQVRCGGHVEALREIGSAGYLQGLHRNQQISIYLEPGLVECSVANPKQAGKVAPNAAFKCPNVTYRTESIAQRENRPFNTASDQSLDRANSLDVEIGCRALRPDAEMPQWECDGPPHLAESSAESDCA